MNCCTRGFVVTGLFWAVCTSAALADGLSRRIERLQADAPLAQVRLEQGRVTQIYGGPIATGESAAATRDRFLQRHVELFGVGVEQLQADAVVGLMDGKFTLFAFRQEVDGIPVYDRWLKLVVRNGADYPLVLANSSLISVGEAAPVALLTAGEAMQAAAAAEPTALNIEEPTLVYYPVRDDEGFEAQVRLAWRVFADNGGVGEFDRWQFFIDALDGSVLAREAGIYHTDISGTVNGFQSLPPFPDQPNNAPQSLPVYGARVRVVGGNTTSTAEDGTFLLPHAGTTAVSVEVDLVGPWSTITNLGSGGLLAGSQLVTPPGPANFVLNPIPSEFLTSQLNALTGVTKVHDFVKGLAPQVSFYDISMPTRVNSTELTCNAYYTLGNPTLNFMRNASGCPNSAYAGVIYHEYGHFVVDFAPGGPDTSDYHEGMSDVLSTLLQNDPCLGHDFFGQGTGCLRNVQTTTQQYPCSGGGHTCGQVIAGGFWDVRSNLINSLGATAGLARARELYMGQILTGNHQVNPSVTVDLLVLDDDDATIENGTPNLGAICDGMAMHNLDCPAFAPIGFVYPDGRPATTGPNAAATIPVDVVPLAGTPVAGTGQLHYSLDGGSFVTVALNELTPNEYEAVLPAAPCDSVYRWYVSAEAVGEGTIVNPIGAPGVAYTTVVATGSNIDLSDDFETDMGWTVTNSGLTDGPWERAIPAGGGVRGDPPTDYDGSGRCYVTDNAAGNSDVDGGSTTLTSPAIDVSALSNPVVSYARWYTNNVGDNPGTDFWVVQISSDGVTWVDLERTTETIAAWVVREFLVSDYVSTAGTIRVRFIASDPNPGAIVEAGVDAFEVRSFECVAVQDCCGDLDGSGQIDLGDFATFSVCFGAPRPPSCSEAEYECADVDGNGVVDLGDFATFSVRFGSAPSCNE